MRDPLLLPAVSVACGVALARFVPFDLQDLIWAVPAVLLLTMLACCHAPRCTAVCVFVLFLFAGIAAAVYNRPGSSPHLNAESGESLILSGCVVEPSAFSDDREQFTLELAPGARTRVSVYLREGAQAPVLHYGQRIEMEAKVRMPRNFQNPGSFDYAGYLARRGIYWTASATTGAPLRVLGGECGSRLWKAVFAVREAALDRLDKLYAGDRFATAMMQAMLIGESAKMEKVWTEDFRRTGTYHALVISGLHISVLAGAILFLVRVCGIPRARALWLATAVAWVYALVSGWQIPVVRSAAGFTLFAIAGLFFRRGRVLNLLALIALIYLLTDPGQLFEASFQLTFLSVAAIGAIAVPVIERTSGLYGEGLRGLSDPSRDPTIAVEPAQMRVEVRLICETMAQYSRVPIRFVFAATGLGLRFLFWTYEMAVVSFSVQIGLALPMIAYFHRLSIAGLTANLLVVPVLSATVPVGFLAIFTQWRLPAATANALLAISRSVVEWHARLEPNHRMPDPPLWLTLTFVSALLWLSFSRRKLAFGATLAVLAVIYVHPVAPRLTPGALELTALDVGQGDSLLVAFPQGQTMLVDAGGIPVFGKRAKSRMDIGEDVVGPYLWTRSIQHIDVMVATHSHEDHIGGMAAALEDFHPRELWTGANPSAGLREQAQRLGVKIVEKRACAPFGFGGAFIRVLAPEADYVPAESPKNNDSLVLELSYGKHRFLLTGDIERPVEERLLAEGRLQRVDVLKVAHHGSKSSSTAAFLEATRPAFAFISVGAQNLYHHPNPDVLARLAEGHTKMFRTDEGGLAGIRSDGKRLEITRAAGLKPRVD